MFKTVAKTVAGIFSVSMAKDFISKMATVRGEFQQLEMGFKTMLGSAEKADALMSQLIKTAATTPFGMTDITQAAKQLLAYGVNAEEVNDTLIRLGDIAAGLSIPIGDLAYLYGTTMVQGRMFTMDLRQFTGRGIPMTEALAEVMGVAKDEVAGLVTAGKVGFNEMQQAIVHLTSEGSKFGGLMEAQSKTITGQLSNLEDAIEQMFNEIGKKTQGVISGAISVVSSIVENYEKVGKVLFNLIKIYGTYKAAVIALSAVENLRYQSALIHMAGMTRMGVITDILKTKMEALNVVMAKNPYALAGATIAALGVSLFNLAKRLDTGAEGSERFNKAMEERTKLYEEEDNAIKESIETLKDETASKEERIKAFNTLHDLYPDIFKDYAQEQEYLQNISTLEKEIAAQRLNRSYTEDTTRLSDLKAQKTQLEEAIAVNQRSAAGSQAVPQLRNELRAIEKEIAAYEEKLNGDEYADMFIGPQPKKGGATDNATKKQNKEYWENLKKKATAELEALTEVEAKGAKGAELKKKILEYDKILSAYGTGSKGSGKGASSDDDREAIQNNFYKQYGSYQKRLQMLSDEWDKTIKSFDEGSADRALAEKQKTYALAAFSYDWLKDNSVDRDAIRKALVKQLDAEIETLDGAAKEAAIARKKVTLAEFDTETGSSENEYLKAWGTMQEKRAAISKEYDDKILAAKDEWAKKSLEKEKQAALYDFDSKNSSEYQKFFTANLTMAKEEVEATAQRIKNGLNAQLRAGTITAEDFLNTWEKIEKQVKDVENATDDLMTYMSGGLDALFSNRQNLGWQMQSAGTIDYQKAAEMYEKALEEGNVEAENTALANMQSAEAMQSAGANMSAAAGQAASTVAVIDAIVHGINDMVNGIADTVDLISDMADAYGADTSVDSGWGKTKQFFSTFAEASQHATNAWDSLKSGNAGGVIKGVVGSWTSWFTSYAKYKDAKLDKKIQKDAEAIGDLQDAYDELGDAISDAFSSNAVKLIEEQNKNLEEQNELIRDQIAKEEKKKNTDKDAIEEYNKQIEENNKLIQKNKEAAIDAIFGEDVQSAISNFADYITDAWAKGNTAAEGAKDIVRSMMKSMVTESIKAYVQASGKMQEIRQAMQDALADGIISDEEDRYIEQLSERLAKDVEKQYGWSNKYYQSDSERGTTSGGITSMSQESADELNGRFTAIQGHTYQINENVELLKEQHLMLVSNTGAILSHVMGIHSDTSDIRAVQQEMRDTLAEVRSIAKSTSDDILLKGIKIK